ncbi:MAG: biotin--[acetyl-CoA-carboxylase] ligase [Candidatus Krumholzibacteriaceae bacterium]|jgi:BirA family biotin operon repressor/biotin-[acetyl-CoA-carboxylase] ligase
MKVDEGSRVFPTMRDLHPARILALCETKRLARRVILYESVDSTNAAAMAAASDGASEGTLFIAGRQTLGRGRKGRRWLSSPGMSLTFSLLLRPKKKEEGLTAILALSVVEALGADLGGLAIKWPNDIFLKGKKLGGILAESKDDAVVIGLGLNVNERRGDIPAEIAGEAVSMCMAAKKTFDRGLVLCRILAAFEGRYGLYQNEGFAAFRRDVQDHLLYIGRPVAVESGGREFTGTMIGITNEGYLCLEAGGAERVFSSGDLTLRARSRPK